MGLVLADDTETKFVSRHLLWVHEHIWGCVEAGTETGLPATAAAGWVAVSQPLACALVVGRIIYNSVCWKEQNESHFPDPTVLMELQSLLLYQKAKGTLVPLAYQTFDLTFGDLAWLSKS